MGSLWAAALRERVMSAPRQNWSACDKPMTHGKDCECVCMLCLCFLKACSHGMAQWKARENYERELAEEMAYAKQVAR